MELSLVKKKIRVDRLKGQAAIQVPLEDDVNITDSRPDVYQVIEEQGEIVIDELRTVTDHVMVKGRLQFCVLYLSDDDVRRPSSMTGKLPFEEQIYLEGVSSTDNICLKKEVEDLNVGLINSRKLSVQALISLGVCAEEVRSEEAAVEVASFAEAGSLNDPEGRSREEAGAAGKPCSSKIEYRKKTVELAELMIQKKDIFRIRQDLELPSGYPNIFEIFWEKMRLTDVQFRLGDGRLSIQGQLHLFCFYEGEGENRPAAWYETSIPFGGQLECHGLKESMLSDISCSIGHKEVEVKPDADGEERMIGVEAVLDLELKMYGEEQTEILADVYGVTGEVEAVKADGGLKQLLMKSTGKTRVNSHLKTAEGLPGMTQICHSDAQIQLAETRITEEGLRITGAVSVKCLYQTVSEELPYDSISGTIPFSFLMEIPGIDPSCSWKLETKVEELSVSMTDAEGADVKAGLLFGVLVFREFQESLIRDVHLSELKEEKIGMLPGIVAYIVGENDSLWDIGKKYYVPVSRIREINGLTGDEVGCGEKLLIVR